MELDLEAVLDLPERPEPWTPGTHSIWTDTRFILGDDHRLVEEHVTGTVELATGLPCLGEALLARGDRGAAGSGRPAVEGWSVTSPGRRTTRQRDARGGGDEEGPNVLEPLRRLVRRLGHQRWFLCVTSHVLPPLDRAIHRITGRRATVTQLVLPILMLHHTGRRSGRRYQTPLTYVEVDRGWAVAASSFGRGDHPSWSENLLEHPRAEVELGDEVHDVEARLVDEDEHAELMPRFEELWPPYRTYRRRVADRGIRIFVLRPVPDEPAPDG